MMTQEFDTPDISDTMPEPPITSVDFAPADEDHTSEDTPIAPEPVAPVDLPTLETRSPELRALNLAIEVHPEAASNYAARGDFFRRWRDRGRAIADYRQALALAERDLAQSSWGFTDQTLRDQILNSLNEMGEDA
jgi:hypothetical protein